jgi:glucosamine-6-phosphate deaminase
MEIRVFDTKAQLGGAAAARAAEALRAAIARDGHARAIAATGASQFEFLDALTASEGIDWGRVEFFHLDEYVGLPENHPASFRRYLKERLVERVHPGTFHFIDGEAADPQAECRRVGALIAASPVDVGFVGIGENGHLAFNDPPADFETEEPFIVVDLDEPCRRQQLGEGWFGSLEEVPPRAISISVRQILKAGELVVSVPDARKAQAVRDCLEGEVTPQHPASILQRHPRATVFLDRDSASLLSAKLRC